MLQIQNAKKHNDMAKVRKKNETNKRHNGKFIVYYKNTISQEKIYLIYAYQRKTLQGPFFAYSTERIWNGLETEEKRTYIEGIKEPYI